jgi:hypothetical protein
MIKKDHKSLFDALSKMSDEELENWMNNLHVVLWADRFTYASEWVGSVRFRFGFCWIGSLPDWNRHSAGSIRFGFEFFRFRFKRQKIQKLLRLSWRCIANKYIYMHLLYVACARDKKNFFLRKL